MKLDKIIENVDDLNILNSWMVANSKLSTYRNILCAVSGGSDSDILVHLCATLDENKRVTYVFFDTGLEFQATKDHIKYLESKYGIKIETRKAVKPIPACCKQYGIPFLSKEVSENIDRLQRHGFDWRDGTYEELVKVFPRCQAGLRWWCNAWGDSSRFNISRHKGLKEFIMSYPPPISHIKEMLLLCQETGCKELFR